MKIDLNGGGGGGLKKGEGILSKYNGINMFYIFDTVLIFSELKMSFYFFSFLFFVGPLLALFLWIVKYIFAKNPKIAGSYINKNPQRTYEVILDFNL